MEELIVCGPGQKLADYTLTDPELFLSFSLNKERLAAIYTTVRSDKKHLIFLLVIDMITQKTILNKDFDVASPIISESTNFKAKIMQGQNMIMLCYTTINDGSTSTLKTGYLNTSLQAPVLEIVQHAQQDYYVRSSISLLDTEDPLFVNEGIQAILNINFPGKVRSVSIAAGKVKLV